MGEKPEVRDAAKEAAFREIKERIKKIKDEKKLKKEKVSAKQQKTQGKGNISKGSANSVTRFVKFMGIAEQIAKAVQLINDVLA
ncbi:hypothetical protein CRYUN_Cryun17cG0094600 [Craigia yunnanensis]